MSDNPFDEVAWRAMCQHIAHQSNQGCGLSYDVYQASFCATVDGSLDKMPEAWKSKAIEIAREFDYLTSDELTAEAEKYSSDRWCAHGIDPQCCPVGCGDRDE